MATFIKEENQFLKKKDYALPKPLLRKLKTTLAQYKNCSQNKGYKRLNSLVNPDYNKRSEQSYKDGRHISYNDLKAIKHDFATMSKNPNDLQNILNGGKDMENFVNSTLNRERNNVKEVAKQAKVATRNKNQVNPQVKPTQPTSADANATKVQEGKTIFITKEQLERLNENRMK